MKGEGKQWGGWDGRRAGLGEVSVGCNYGGGGEVLSMRAERARRQADWKERAEARNDHRV